MMPKESLGISSSSASASSKESTTDCMGSMVKIRKRESGVIRGPEARSMSPTWAVPPPMERRVKSPSASLAEVTKAIHSPLLERVVPLTVFQMS